SKRDALLEALRGGKSALDPLADESLRGALADFYEVQVGKAPDAKRDLFKDDIYKMLLAEVDAYYSREEKISQHPDDPALKKVRDEKTKAIHKVQNEKRRLNAEIGFCQRVENWVKDRWHKWFGKDTEVINASGRRDVIQQKLADANKVIEEDKSPEDV